MFLALSLSKNDLIALRMTAVVLLVVCGVLTGFLLYYKKKAKDEAVKGTRTSEFLSMLLDTKDKKLIKKKKKRKILSNVIFYCLLVLFIPVFIYAVSNRITNNRRPFGDKRVRVVASGSRSFKNEANKNYLEDETLRKEYNLDNQFSKNDRIIVSKPKSNADIHLYDVVVYENEKTNRTIIHRIIKIDDSTGTPHYSTRGDANDADDGYDLTFKDIVGVYTNKKIDKIGAVVLFLQSPIGISTFIAVLYSRIRIDLVSNSRDKVSDEYVSKLKKRVKFPDFEIKKVTFYLEDEKVTLDSQGNRERIKEEYSGPIREVYEECGKEQKILFDKEEKQNA